MKRLIFISTLTLSLTNCSSLSRSLSLGGGIGLASGATAGALATDSSNNVKPENIAIGAAIGIGAGLLTSYLLNNDQEKRMRTSRGLSAEKIYYGDLPPNPFEIDQFTPQLPKGSQKK